MSSHDCRITGFLTLKDGVTEESIRATLADFLKYADTDFDTEVGENIEFNGVDGLFLSIDFQGYGGYQNDDVDALFDSLSAIAHGGQWLEFHDFDTGYSEFAKVPRFIGTVREQRQGQLQYGISMMADWIKPLIGLPAFESVDAYIKAQPLIEIDS